MKICILGYSGSGKSTLAKTLGARYGVPVLHLDSVNFLENWKLRDRTEMNAIVEDFLNGNDGWVIDGSYKKCHLTRRMEEADLVVFLLFNRFTCFFRAWKRYRTFKGKTRADMAKGCEEKFDAEFAWWVLYKGRTKKRRKAFSDLINKYGEKSVVLKTQKQLDKFLREEK